VRGFGVELFEREPYHGRECIIHKHPPALTGTTSPKGGMVHRLCEKAVVRARRPEDARRRTLHASFWLAARYNVLFGFSQEVPP